MSELGPLAEALAQAQAEFPSVTRSKTVKVQTKTGGSYTFSYAPLDVILGAVGPSLTKHGLAMAQLLDGGDLVTLLVHSSGASLEGRTPLPAMTDIQSFGSAITYLRRYAIQALLGIAAEEDDDGNRAAGNATRPAEKSAASPDEPVLEQMSPLRDGQATLHGTVAAGKTATTDLLLRQTPDGYAFGFVLVSETRGRTQVLARDVLAQDIWDAIGHDSANLYNKEVTVEGELTHVPWEKDGRAMKPYKQLALTKLRTPEWVLPDEPPEEAESMSLFAESLGRDEVSM